MRGAPRQLLISLFLNFLMDIVNLPNFVIWDIVCLGKFNHSGPEFGIFHFFLILIRHLFDFGII